MILPDWKLLKAALQGRLARTRFAPSPTGYLHLGHVVNALYVWGLARALDGEVVLRMEDHDRTRCKPIFETAILEDLEWLGLVPDIGLPADFFAGASPFRQQDCDARYQAARMQLQDSGHVYACDCSRKRILARTGQGEATELRYDGFCRDRNLQDGPGMTLRVRLPDGQVDFQDFSLGEQVQQPSLEIGDVAIRDNQGNWTYQFAVVVDDLAHGIQLIVRGMDLLSSTGRQIQIAKLLGSHLQPIYLHHPLLVDAQGRKLSKRDFAADIHALHLQGISAEAVIGQAAHLAGLQPIPQPQTLQAILNIFVN